MICQFNSAQKLLPAIAFDRAMAVAVYKDIRNYNRDKIAQLVELCLPLVHKITDPDWQPSESEAQDYIQQFSLHLLELIHKAIETKVPVDHFIAWLFVRLKFEIKKIRCNIQKSLAPPIPGGIDVKTAFYDANTKTRIANFAYVALRQKLWGLPRYIMLSSRLPRCYDSCIYGIVLHFIRFEEIILMKLLQKKINATGNPLDLSARFLIDHVFMIARMKLHDFTERELPKSAVYSEEWQQILEYFSNAKIVSFNREKKK